MVFTIHEIKQYLESCTGIAEAVSGLSEQGIVDCIPVDDFASLNFVKNEANLERYEASIGMQKLKEEQRTLHRNTEGKQGRYWMALSPKWNEGQKPESEYKIAYWVNYGDNQTYGWFSVEDIKRWFANPELKLHELGGTKER